MVSIAASLFVRSQGTGNACKQSEAEVEETQ
jgi:hypothetical protein